MTLWFIVGSLRGRSDVADVAWGGTFIAISMTSYLLGPRSELARIVSLIVLVWGIRLSLHIYGRNRRKKEDSRYKELKARWGKVTKARIYTRIFVVQAALATLVSFPVIIASNSETRIGLVQIFGLFIWLVGFCFEVVGDAQLKNFLSKPRDPGSILSSGLWKYSRHPNYFGEVTGWWGIWIMALSSPFGWLGIVGPLTITYLILFVSGVPLLESRYQDNKSYQEYARKTSKFIPLLPRS